MSSRVPPFLSEQARSARKYNSLLLALRHTHEIAQEIERSPHFTIADVLQRLLPHYVTALEAERGFIARRGLKKPLGRSFEVIAVDPPLRTEVSIVSSARLEKMIGAGGSRILTTQEHEGVISELRGFGARSAVLASFRALENVYLVGMLDKVNAEAYPFLTADRHVLENLLSLLALGVRSVERRQRELRMIQEISETIVASDESAGGIENVWQTIARNIVDVCNAQVVSIYAFNRERKQLEPRCAWDAVRVAEIGRGAPLPIDGASLNGFVARSRTSKYLPDVAANPALFLSTELEAEMRSAYCTPLISRQELVGTLYAASSSPDGIAADDRDAIDRLAPHAAIALHNALLLERNRQALKIDEDVIEIQQAIADVLQQERQAVQLRSVLLRFFPPESDFFVAGFHPDTQQIRPQIVYEKGLPVERPGEHPLYGKARCIGERGGLIDYMWRHGCTILDVPDFAQWEGAAEIAPMFRDGVRCCLITTLTHNREVTGWLGFRNYTRPGLFDARHRTLLEKTAPHIAIVQHNAKLYDRQIEEQQIVSQFQTAITHLSESEQQEIESVAEEVRIALEKLGVYTGEFYIARYDEKRNILRVPVCYENGAPLSRHARDAHPAYRTRPIEQRNGLVEWILRNDEPVLARTRAEIEAWETKGVTDLPESARCWLGVPMHTHNATTGVMVVRSSSSEGIFEESHVPLFHTIANQAAITIDNARLFQEQGKQHTAIYRAAQAIAAAGLELDSVLNTILEQAVRVTGSHLGMLYLLDGDNLRLRSLIAPAEWADEYRRRFEFVPRNQPCVMTRALDENRAQLVTDVTAIKPYLDVSGGDTRAELAVVLQRGDGTRTPIGVLNVEHREVGGLDDGHRRLLISLAHLAVAAIQNAEKAQELSRLHMIAIMNVFSADVIHDVKQEVSAIRWAVERLRSAKGVSPALLPDLAEIDEAAARMRVLDLSRPERSLNFADGETEPTAADRIVADEVNAFVMRTGINVRLELGCAATNVRMQDEWLRRLVRHYLKNAEKHLPARNRRIVVRTVRDDVMVTVYVEDNGRGVRQDIRDRLFGREIAHEDGPPGRGLLLVWLVAEAHGGRAWLDHSELGKGSCFAFSVPIAAQPALKDTSS